MTVPGAAVQIGPGGGTIGMQGKRKEIRGSLTLPTLLRVSAVSGFAIGFMLGIFSGIVHFLVNGNFAALLMIFVAAPVGVALLLMLVTLMGHPLYTVLTRMQVLGVDRISVEISGK